MPTFTSYHLHLPNDSMLGRGGKQQNGRTQPQLIHWVGGLCVTSTVNHSVLDNA